MNNLSSLAARPFLEGPFIAIEGRGEHQNHPTAADNIPQPLYDNVPALRLRRADADSFGPPDSVLAGSIAIRVGIGGHKRRSHGHHGEAERI